MTARSRSELRRALRAARRQLSESAQQLAAEQVHQHLRNRGWLPGKQRVGGYWPADGELRPWSILQDIWQVGGKVFLPCLDPLGTRRLRFRLLSPGQPLEINRFGIPEPQTGNQPAALWSLDLILVPLVAFDATGNRLGMGGGFYDATLQPVASGRLPRRPTLVGLAHCCQEVASIQPMGHDVALDYIVTPNGIRPAGGPRR